MNVVPDALQQICDQAEAAAHGDQRTALAMLLGAFVDQASRMVNSEQPSDRWLLAMAAYCQAASDKLRETAQFYVRGHRTSDDERGVYFAQLAGAQQAGESFADHLQQRFDELGLVASPDDDRYIDQALS